jgi:hypothetical protein
VARDRNNKTSTDQTRLQASLIRQKHCAIRPHLPAELGFRQGQGIVAILGCWVGGPKASAEPIVFIVSYHNLDYAKEACRAVLSMEPEATKTIRDLANNPLGLEPADWVKDTVTAAAECKSVRDTRELGTRLENELTDALAVEPLCAGVTVIRDPHPDFNGGNFSEAVDTIKQKGALLGFAPRLQSGQQSVRMDTVSHRRRDEEFWSFRQR